MSKKSKANKSSLETKMAEAYKLIRALDMLSVQSKQIVDKLKEVNGEIQELEAKDGS